MADGYAFQAPFGRRTEGPYGRGVYVCSDCGKRFATTRQMDGHERSRCKPSKRSLADMLAESKALWQSRKKRKTEAVGGEVSELGPASVLEPESSQLAMMSEGDRNPAVLRDMHSPPGSPAQCRPAPSVQPALAAEQLPKPIPNLAPAEGVLAMDDLDLSIATRKAGRSRRAPKRYREDDLPERLPAAKPQEAAPPTEDTVEIAAPDVEEPPTPPPRVLAPIFSKRNTFGISRSYVMPAGAAISHDPDQVVTLRDLTNTLTIPKAPRNAHPFGPFPNLSAFSLAEWYWNSNKKSFADFQKLIRLFRDPSFTLNDAVDLNWKSVFQALGSNKDDLPEEDAEWIQDDGWRTSEISIDVPFHNRMKNPGVKSFLAGTLRHRSIVSVIKEKILNEKDSRQFHYQPYRATWKPTESSPEVGLYGEMYSSQAFQDAHEEVQRLSIDGSEASMERVVVALMFWSDSTHLTSFGPASLWPCYMFFGNESKYRRCQPSQGLCHHVAYFQKMPDTFTDWLKELNSGKMPTDKLFAHCSREIFQKQWSILLDKELVKAMKDGLSLCCPDGRRRLFFPRVFTYSADYPEKTLVAGVRQNGSHPCPRCMVAKEDIWGLGAPTDVERYQKQRDEQERRRLVASAAQDILKHGYAVAGSVVEAKMKPTSIVPVVNAFSSILADFSFSILPALVVDQMHEFEIGVWKRLFIHLIRLLEAFTTTSGPTLSAELDARYRATPSFGRNTLRKFGLNASTMKRKAARDYENLLQCAIPAFESLLPEFDDSILMTLLFVCAQWHALAKLRMHNDYTLALLERTTTLLGAHMRRFDQETCARTPTKELAKEAAARARHEGKAKGSHTRKSVGLNIYTIKFHFLGDYPDMIHQYGTSDSYTTEVGELCHREPKAWFDRTDKKEFERQVAQIERRQARLAAIRQRLSNDSPSATAGGATTRVRRTALSPDGRYSIAYSEKVALDLSTSFVDRNPGTVHQDHYLVDFIPKLKQHLLPRVLERLGLLPEEAGSAAWPSVVLKHNRLYSHQLLHCNYTTYDVRRDDDVLHVNTSQCNIMLLNEDYCPETWSEEHPYLYARILGIYHADVSYIGVLPDGTRRYGWHRIDFLWIHWYDTIQAAGEFRLDRAVPASLSSEQALGFVDPSDVLRGVHLIPRFTMPKIRSVRSNLVKTDDLWREYHINRFVDRDMFMRYQFGMSVGHTYMKSNFPPPQVPPLPVNFNHYLPNHPKPQANLNNGRDQAPSEGIQSSLNDAPARAPTDPGSSHPAGGGDDLTRVLEDLVEEEEVFADDDEGFADDDQEFDEGSPAFLEDNQELDSDGVSEIGEEDDRNLSKATEDDYMDELDDDELEAYHDMYYADDDDE